MMRAESRFCSSFIKALPTAKAEAGYAMILTLLLVGIVGTVLMGYQITKIRDTRYQTYYALGQDFAVLARAAHTYVQDVAYYDPYLHSADTMEIQRVGYFEGAGKALVDAFHQPLIDVDGVIDGNNAAGRFGLQTIQAPLPGGYNGFADPDFSFSRPIRGVKYTFTAHGGLLPLRTIAELQGASALIVLKGEEVSMKSDVRTFADMAAFRAGAASNGLGRVGVVLPINQRSGLMCHGQPAVVAWGNADTDCLTDTDANGLGMALQPFDIVAPAWDTIQKNLVRDVLLRRPQPGQSGANIMYADLQMDGVPGGMGEGHPNHITDANEALLESVNIENAPTTTTALNIGDQTSGAALGDAMLVVGHGNNPYFPYDSICARKDAGACVTGKVNVERNMAVFYRPDTDPKAIPKQDPTTILAVKGVVEVAQGSLTVNADDALHNGERKGYFDVKGTGGATHATFKINGQSSGGNGTVINKTVKANKFKVEDTTGSENFIVHDELAIEGGDIKIGNGTQPSQVIFASAPLKSAGGATPLSIDTSTKGAGNGVYSKSVQTDSFEQTDPSQPVTFKEIQIVNDPGDQVKIKGTVNVDPQNTSPNTYCVGKACPDYVTGNPSPAPF